MKTNKTPAPGEARTHNLRISPLLLYKYGALTDCATGASVRLFLFHIFVTYIAFTSKHG